LCWRKWRCGAWLLHTCTHHLSPHCPSAPLATIFILHGLHGPRAFLRCSGPVAQHISCASMCCKTVSLLRAAWRKVVWNEPLYARWCCWWHLFWSGVVAIVFMPAAPVWYRKKEAWFLDDIAGYACYLPSSRLGSAEVHPWWVACCGLNRHGLLGDAPGTAYAQRLSDVRRRSVARRRRDVAGGGDVGGRRALASGGVAWRRKMENNGSTSGVARDV